MKKTLIALMAFAGVTFGKGTQVTFGDAKFHEETVASTVTLSGYSNSANWGYVLTLNVDALESLFSTKSSSIQLIKANNSGNRDMGVSFNTDADGNAYSQAIWQDSLWSDSRGKDVTLDATLDTLNWNKVAAAALTFGTGKVAANYTLTFVDATGTVLATHQDTIEGLLSSSGTNPDAGIVLDTGYVTGFYVYDGQYSAEVLKAASIAAAQSLVPEPATATLSLLALAGLCARRRRK